MNQNRWPPLRPPLVDLFKRVSGQSTSTMAIPPPPAPLLPRLPLPPLEDSDSLAPLSKQINGQSTSTVAIHPQPALLSPPAVVNPQPVFHFVPSPTPPVNNPWHLAATAPAYREPKAYEIHRRKVDDIEGRPQEKDRKDHESRLMRRKAQNRVQGLKRKRTGTRESDITLAKKLSPIQDDPFASDLLMENPFDELRRPPIQQWLSRDSSAMFGAPDFTGRWTKLEDIPSATGGNSDIYKARLDQDAMAKSKLVAVKVLRSIRIRPGFAPEEILKKRLMREMSIWCQLAHENIVPFLGYAFNGTFPCMVAPWYENGNLPDYITRHPAVDKTQMVLESLNGLVHLHSRDPPVVHGDLKASNILVDDQGHARITDFGLSRIMEEGHTGWTTSTGVSGTHRWMAPELLLTERCKPTTAADVYSVTLLVLEIYTGKIPFPHLDAAPFFRAIVAEKSPERSHYSPFDPPEDVWQVFEHGWSFQPDQRPRIEILKKKLEKALTTTGWR
ncbi:hypothetical protein FRC02_000833 [Tulasnella sp. 418]|nr:hypothetical protein FRC02_000833 [Tulasnella sp. 418]